MRIYVVTMQRWADNETHHYLEGVYDSLSEAERNGEEERLYRGGSKYYPVIEAVELNQSLIKRKPENES